MGLTAPQEYVASQDDHTMCCALPGSGKSHTMVELSNNLVTKDPKYRVLLITFTRAAADELNERLRGKLSTSGIRRCEAATFDSIFGRQLKQAQTTKKSTIVGGEQYIFVERAMRHCGISIEIDEAMQWIDTYGRMIKPTPIQGDASTPGWLLFTAYQNLMEKTGKQDFNGIAREAYLGVEQGRIKPWNATHILVDEFQDTSDMQYQWIRVHGEYGAKLVVVGDDDQSIYSWRGAAGYENMENFQADFGARISVLNMCFRCRPEILAGAGRVIEHNEDRVPKEMISGRDAGGKVSVNGYLTSGDEYNAMIQAIQSDNKEWAVLARTNRILDEAETYLKMHKIPYKRLGGKKLWDDHVANIVLKLLWCLIRPKDTRFIGDIIGWLGEDEEVIQYVMQYLQTTRAPFADFISPAWLTWHPYTEELHNNWVDWGLDTKGQGELTARMKNIMDFLHKVRGNKGREARTIELVADIVTKLKIEGGFVDRIELLGKNLAPSTGNTEEETEQGVVTLSSLHSSKGLQWAQVWIAASNQGVCPSANSLEEESTGGIPEERRLFYVGMTRAVDELVMSFSHNPQPIGTQRSKEPSQFLYEGFPEEMEQEHIKLDHLAEEAKNKVEEDVE
ncbi:ATP-dependent helicase [Vibrio sp. 10N.261.46.E12]|uniref:ATP-dependent helicase n=1 Tax=unclassified Vibrio TaxID=2614977 RepID=UPI00097562DE|nr:MULTISPECIES: ATP-dependent helicase [unclassified Vibrio]